MLVVCCCLFYRYYDLFCSHNLSLLLVSVCFWLVGCFYFCLLSLLVTIVFVFFLVVVVVLVFCFLLALVVDCRCISCLLFIVC